MKAEQLAVVQGWDDTRATLEERARVAPAAEGPIDIEPAFARRERFHRLREQDRDMAEPMGRGGGAGHEAPGATSASRSARRRRTRSRA